MNMMHLPENVTRVLSFVLNVVQSHGAIGGECIPIYCDNVILLYIHFPNQNQVTEKNPYVVTPRNVDLTVVCWPLGSRRMLQRPN